MPSHVLDTTNTRRKLGLCAPTDVRDAFNVFHHANIYMYRSTYLLAFTHRRGGYRGGPETQASSSLRYREGFVLLPATREVERVYVIDGEEA